MSEKIIDLEDVLKRIQGDKELLIELIEIFIEDCPSKFDSIDGLLKSSDAVALSEVAHSIKGAASNISAKKLWKTFLEMEETAKSQNLDPVGGLYERALMEFEELKNYFPELKEKLQQA